MRLTVRHAAELLRTPEKQIYRWIDEGELPCYWVNEQARFNRTELLEWATARRLPISTNLFCDPEEGDRALPGLRAALEAGGVHYHVAGTDRESVLRAMIQAMHLPDEVDRETLIAVLLARESAGSTAVGDGIAIPHVRQPIAVHGGAAAIALCFLEQPVDFGAADGRPVHTLFTMVTPTIHVHLQLLAKLALALHDPELIAAITRRAPASEILLHVSRAEAAVPSPTPALP